MPIAHPVLNGWAKLRTPSLPHGRPQGLVEFATVLVNPLFGTFMA